MEGRKEGRKEARKEARQTLGGFGNTRSIEIFPCGAHRSAIAIPPLWTKSPEKFVRASGCVILLVTVY